MLAGGWRSPPGRAAIPEAAIGFINPARVGAAFVGPVMATTMLGWTSAAYPLRIESAGRHTESETVSWCCDSREDPPDGIGVLEDSYQRFKTELSPQAAAVESQLGAPRRR
jgi:hypothetical protein